MKKYLGDQKILQEEEKDGIVKVTLEISDKDANGQPLYPLAQEEVYYTKEVLDELTFDKPNADYSAHRNVRCKQPVHDIILVLLKNCVKQKDLDHIFASVNLTLKNADLKKEMEYRNKTDDAWSVYDVKDKLLK